MRNLLNEIEPSKDSVFIERRLCELRSESINVEDFFVAVKKTIESSISNFTDYIKFLNTVDGTNKTAEATVRLIDKIEKKIEGMNFIVMGEVAVPCPDGFKSDFSGYVLSLSNERANIIDSTFKALEDFNVFLAMFLSEKDSKISLKDDGKKYAAMKQLRENQVKNFQSYFTSGVNQRQYLNKMFESKSDIVPISKITVDTWKNVREIDPKNIKEKCDVISARLQSVLNNSSNSSKVSKQAILNLSEGSYEVGRQVEHLALYMARCEIASVTVANIFERLDGLLKH